MMTSTGSVHGALFTLIRRLHFYIGLFVAPFIFVAALTGTLYVLTPQIENALYADALTTQPQGKAQPLSAQIAAARAHTGERAKIYAVRPAPGATDTTRVQFTRADLGASESRSVFIDPYTLAIKGDMTVYGTTGVLPFRMWLDQLHRGLLLGDVGRLYSELAASWLWIAALGGVILWLGTRSRRVVKKSGARHWHVTLGLVLAAGLLFFSATGLTWSQWAGSNVDRMRAALNWMTPQVNTALDGRAPDSAPDPHADHNGSSSMPGMDMSMPMPAAPKAPAQRNRPDADWDRVLSSAKAAGLQSPRLELRQPKNSASAWTVTEVDRSWPSHVDAVAVNPETFSVIDRVRFADFPLVAKLTRWGVDAHMGVLFGLPNQLLLAAFGLGLCTMIVLGYRMWWQRRPKQSETSPAQTLAEAWLPLPGYIKATSLLIALALGYALPVMGASLLLFVLFDILRWRDDHRVVDASVVYPDTPIGIMRARFAVKRKEMRYFLRSLVVLILVVGTVITNAVIGGVVDQYQIPFSDWTITMYIMQGLMVGVYSLVITGLLSIPLWYFFLGESDKQGE